MGGHGSGSNPNSKRNLKQWQKGESGNPGALRGWVGLSKELKNLSGEMFPDDPSGRTYAGVLAEKLWKLACGPGNSPPSVKAAELIMNYTEGKPLQAVDLNVTRSPEEHVAGILESLQELSAQPDRNRAN
jgi:hypothetical protein